MNKRNNSGKLRAAALMAAFFIFGVCSVSFATTYNSINCDGDWTDWQGDEHMDEDAGSHFYITWYSTSIYFRWDGSNWETDGDMFIYIATSTFDGTMTSVNWNGTQTLPDNMHYAFCVDSGTVKDLYEYSGGWSTVPWTGSAYIGDMGSQTTEISIPFTDMGISTSTAIKVLAFAQEETSNSLWAKFPDENDTSGTFRYFYKIASLSENIIPYQLPRNWRIYEMSVDTGTYTPGQHTVTFSPDNDFDCDMVQFRFKSAVGGNAQFIIDTDNDGIFEEDEDCVMSGYPSPDSLCGACWDGKKRNEEQNICVANGGPYKFQVKVYDGLDNETIENETLSASSLTGWFSGQVNVGSAGQIKASYKQGNDYDWWNSRYAVASSTGYYELYGVKDGEYMVRASADQYASSQRKDEVISGTSGTHNIDFSLVWGARAIGTITDFVTGNPLYNVDINFVAQTSPYLGEETWSNYDGNYEDHVNTGTYIVQTQKEGYGEVQKTISFLAAGSTTTVNFVLPRAGSIVGQVVYQSSPVNNCPVKLYASESDYYNRRSIDEVYTQTVDDSSGTYVFLALPAGSYTVGVWPNPEWGMGFAHHNNIQVFDDKVTDNTVNSNVNFDLPIPGVLTGLVTAAGGPPLDGDNPATVTLYWTANDTEVDNYSMSNVTNTYTFDGIAPSTYAYYVRAKRMGMNNPDEVEVEISSGSNTQDLSLASLASTITGLITDNEGVDHENLLVFAMEPGEVPGGDKMPDWAAQVDSTTLNYTCYVDSSVAKYDLAVLIQGEYGPEAMVGRTLNHLPGSTTADMTIDYATQTISGRATASDGEPVQNMMIWVWRLVDSTTHLYGMAHIESGDYSIGYLPPDYSDYKLQFVKLGFNDGWLTDISCPSSNNDIVMTADGALDIEAPSISFIYPSVDGKIRYSSATIQATLTDNHGVGIDTSTIILALDGDTKVNSSNVNIYFSTSTGVLAWEATVLNEGTHTVHVEVSDLVLNNNTLNWIFTVDTAPPAISSFTCQDSDGNHDTRFSPNYDGKEEVLNISFTSDESGDFSLFVDINNNGQYDDGTDTYIKDWSMTIAPNWPYLLYNIAFDTNSPVSTYWDGQLYNLNGNSIGSVNEGTYHVVLEADDSYDSGWSSDGNVVVSSITITVDYSTEQNEITSPADSVKIGKSFSVDYTLGEDCYTIATSSTMINFQGSGGPFQYIITASTGLTAGSHTLNLDAQSIGLQKNQYYDIGLYSYDLAGNYCSSDSTSTAYGVHYVTLHTTGNAVGYNVIKASSNPQAILGLNITEEEGTDTLSFIKVSFDNNSGFATSDLVALSNTTDSGVAIYRENNATEGYQDGVDTLISYTSPSWSGGGPWTTDFNITGETLPSTWTATTHNYYVVIKSSSSMSNGDNFNVYIDTYQIHTSSYTWGYPSAQIGHYGISCDTVTPEVSFAITGDSASGNSTARDKVTIFFSEPLDGSSVDSDGSDFLVTGSTVTGAVLTGDTTVTLTLDSALSTDATPYASIVADGVRDIAGNYNEPGGGNLVDGLSPEVAMVDVRSGSLIEVTFSESMSTMTLTDSSYYTASGGTGDNFTPNPDAALLDWYPPLYLHFQYPSFNTGDTDVSLSVSTNVCDSAGNHFSIVVSSGIDAGPAEDAGDDFVPPSLTQTITTSTGTINMTFTEELYGAQISTHSFAVSGNDLTGVYVDSNVVTLNLLNGIGTGDTPDVSITGDGVPDLWANQSSTGTYVPTDGIKPEVSFGITGDSASGNSTARDKVTIFFSEPLNASTVQTSDFSIVGSTIISALGAGATVTLTLEEELFTDTTPYASVAADSVKDIAGNDNEYGAGNLADGLSPEVATVNVKSGSLIEITFSESMSTMTLTDSSYYTASGGTGDEFTPNPDGVSLDGYPPITYLHFPYLSFKAADNNVSLSVSTNVCDSAGNHFSIVVSSGIDTGPAEDAGDDFVPPAFVSALTTSTGTINVTFSEELYGAQISTHSFAVSDNDLTNVYVDSNVVTLNLLNGIGTGDTPDVSITGDGVPDLWANQSSTGTYPSTDGIKPCIDPTSGVGVDVLSTSRIKLTYTEPMSTTTLTDTGDYETLNGPTTYYPVSIMILSSTTVRLDYIDSPFAGGDTIKVTVATETVTDASGNPMDAAYNWGQETNAALDETKPVMNWVRTGDSVNGNSTARDSILMSFSEELDSVSVSTGDFSVDGSNVTGVDVSSNVVTLILASQLATDATSLVEISSGTIQDLAGNWNIDGSSYAIDGLKVEVSSINVISTTWVEVYFSEMMSAAGLNTATNYTQSGGVGSNVNPQSVDISANPVVKLIYQQDAAPTFAAANDVIITVSSTTLTDLSGNKVSPSVSSGNDFPASGEPGDDFAPPTITSAVAISTGIIEVTFSEDLSSTTVSTDDFDVAGGAYAVIGATETIPGQVILSVSQMPTDITPEVRLTTTCLADVKGNWQLAGSSVTATDEIKPQIDPTSSVGVDILSATRIKLTYTEPMANDGALNNEDNYATLKGGTTYYPNSVTVLTVPPADTVVKLDYTSVAFAGGDTIKVTVTGAITDILGNHMDAVHNWGQETSAVLDETKPVMNSAITGDKAGGSSSARNKITVLFSEPLDVTTIQTGDFSVAGSTITGASLSGGTTVTLTLSSSLLTDATPQLGISADVLQDEAGNFNLAGSSFCIDGLVPVMTWAITGDTDTANSTATNRILVDFSEDLSSATVNAGDFGIAGAYQVTGATEIASGRVILSIAQIPTDLKPLITLTTYLSDVAGNENPGGGANSITPDDGLCPTDVTLDTIESKEGAEKTVSLNWSSYSAPSDVATYKIYWSSNQFTDASTVTSNASTTNKSYDVGGLENNTTYWFAVTARDTSGNEDYDVTSSSGMATDELPPAKTTQVSACDKPSDSGDAIIVSWTSGTESDIARYVIYWAAEKFTQVSVAMSSQVVNGATASSGTVSGLTIDTQDYYFGVVAIDTQDNYDSTVGKCVGPVRAINNLVDTSADDDTITSDTDPDTSVTVDQGTNNGIYINVLKPGKDKKDNIDAANSSALTDPLIIPATIESVKDTGVEFKSSADLTADVTIKIHYPSSITGEEEKYLRIFRLDEDNNKWVLVNEKEGKQHVDTDKDIVTTRTSHFSVYRVMGAVYAASNLDNVIVYPNPFKPTDGESKTGTWSQGIFFGNLTKGAEIKIFTISGDFVGSFEKTDSYSGRYQWEVGDNLASGIYIYLITNPDDKTDKATGKFAIIK